MVDLLTVNPVKCYSAVAKKKKYKRHCSSKDIVNPFGSLKLN